MSDLGGKLVMRRRKHRHRPTPPFEKASFQNADDVISQAAHLEAREGSTATFGHKIVSAAREFAEIYDENQETPSLQSLFAVATAYKSFKNAVNENTQRVYDAHAMLGAVRWHNLTPSAQNAENESNQNKKIEIPSELDVDLTGKGYQTRVKFFSRPAAARVFAEMVQVRFNAELGSARAKVALRPPAPQEDFLPPFEIWARASAPIIIMPTR